MSKPYIDFIRYAIHSNLSVLEGADRIDRTDYLEFCKAGGDRACVRRLGAE